MNGSSQELPTYDPWGVVNAVMFKLAADGFKPRLSSDTIGEAKEAASALLMALGVLPVVPDYAAEDAVAEAAKR
ncbi:hypothetical protein [Amycolatopsis sp. H20-H5]|uniref:hypothetical protein n=1 Tax=Amycolatopsis sp. H20-H5 TaxID=3046309 RepID=UPI002DBB28A2|nr:hypothetical protein [Amycolatopsis sp. H20-H5]MEC3975066.1 hypothetical protein [Amycolatopsis sp. H20-H5]